MPAAGRVGDKAKSESDAHGCTACPHTVIGPGIAGSPDVVINSKPALRVGDPGIHAPCCGPNMWTAKDGAQTVIINGKSAYRKGDPSQHCGGSGKLIEGSPDVIVDDEAPGGAGASAADLGTGSPGAQDLPLASLTKELAQDPGDIILASWQPREDGDDTAAASTHYIDVRLDGPAEQRAPGDRFELKSTDGKYRRVLSRKDAIKGDGGAVILRFTRVRPGKKYGLRHLLVGDAGPAVFAAVPFAQIGAYGPETPGPPASKRAIRKAAAEPTFRSGLPLMTEHLKGLEPSGLRPDDPHEDLHDLRRG